MGPTLHTDHKINELSTTFASFGVVDANVCVDTNVQ